MSNRPPIRKPKESQLYGTKGPLPNMATPRKLEPPKKGGCLGLFFVALIMGGVVWLVMLIFGLGPYQPDPVESTKTPTSVVALGVLTQPTATLTQTLVPSATITMTPSATYTLTPTPEIYPFILFGDPETMSSATIRPQLSCDWLVIAGQVKYLDDKPAIGLNMHLFGNLAGFSIDEYRETGSASAYGESGFEFALKDLVIDSEESLFIQLEDTNGQFLTTTYVIQTYQDCQKNMILLNFKEVR